MKPPTSTFILFVACAAWAATQSSTSAAADTPLPPQAVSSFTADPEARYPFRENMYEAVTLPDGRIVALSVARRNQQQTMQARYSPDEGRTWSQPQDLFDWPKSAGGFA